MASSALHIDALPRTLELVLVDDTRAELVFVDQRKLPYELVFARAHTWVEVVDAIKTLGIRGAPAIGVAGAAAMTLWVCEVARACTLMSLAELARVADAVVSARPTAVNLAWGVQQVVDALSPLMAAGASAQALVHAAYTCVKDLEAADEAANRALGAHGAALLPQGARVLTHCNAGSLATVYYGTALGVIYTAAEQGNIKRVYADETRPVGQGARLTAWELAQAGVPCTLICDNMAASLMARGEIDAVVVGADRIAVNGDTANKIGTYGLAVLAHHHYIPLYVAAPLSTIDKDTATGADIPIEERTATEVLPQPIVGVDVYNPAFDVTPAHLITAIITEQGVMKPPFLGA